MKHLSLKLSSMLLAVAFQPAFAAGIVNGDFENGLTGWNVITAGQANPITVTDMQWGAAILTGNYAHTSQNGPGHSLLYQDYTVTSGPQNVFFDFAYQNSAGDFFTPDTLDFVGANNQQARFDILKPGSAADSMDPNDIIVTVYKTNPGDSLNEGWSTKTVDVSADLAAYVGQNVVFRFAQVDNQNLFSLYLDNINIGEFQFLPAAPALSTLGSTTAAGNRPGVGAARAIDASPDLLSRFAAISGGDKEISNAVDQTLPLMTGSQSLAMTNAITGANRVIQARQEGLQGRSSGDEFQGDNRVWFKPFGSWANQDDRKGVAGYDSRTYGMVFGADGEINDKNRIGAAFAYARSNIDSNSSVAPQSATVNTYQVALYGSHSLSDATDINFQVDIGRHNTEGKRHLLFEGTTARSDYSTWSAHIGSGISHTITFNERTSFTPSARFDYTVLRDDSYREKGADVFNLNVGKNRVEALIVGVDGKLAHNLNDNVTLVANLGVGYDVINEQASLTAFYAGAPQAAFSTKGMDPSPWLARGGFGITTKANDRIEITARYDAEVRENFDNQTASVKFRWAF